jgi:ABC-type multidrug transport system permease subunit
MPKFISRRALYELRERPSRTYSWKVFILSQVIVELPWQALLGICTWASFYFSVYGWKQDPQRQGLVFLFVLQFFLFASSFAHLIASAVPSPVLGSMLALFMFVLSLLSNGVMQAPSALPPFWNYMHKVSPLTYYVGGISATALHGRPIHCSDQEMVSFDAPAGQTCGQYLERFLEIAPGKLYNWNSTGQCQYCPLRSADQYLANRDISWELRWRDYGILWAYFAFNILGAIFLYYLFRVLPYSRKNKGKKTNPQHVMTDKK